MMSCRQKPSRISLPRHSCNKKRWVAYSAVAEEYSNTTHARRAVLCFAVMFCQLDILSMMDQCRDSIHLCFFLISLAHSASNDGAVSKRLVLLFTQSKCTHTHARVYMYCLASYYFASVNNNISFTCTFCIEHNATCAQNSRGDYVVLPNFSFDRNDVIGVESNHVESANITFTV